jgi:hypothetical protein
MVSKQSVKYLTLSYTFLLFFSIKVIRSVKYLTPNKAWCAENNVKALKKQTLIGELDDLDVKVKRSNGKNDFHGVKME